MDVVTSIVQICFMVGIITCGSSASHVNSSNEQPSYECSCPPSESSETSPAWGTGATFPPYVEDTNELGCKSSTEIYHNGTKQCYPRFNPEEGPCAIGMALAEVPSGSEPPASESAYTQQPSKYGKCQCIYNDQCQGRPVIYWRPDNRCYNAYDQGPCKKDEWIVNNDKWEPECRKTVCPNLSPNRTPSNWSEAELQFDQQRKVNFNFTYNGACYETGTQAFCRNGSRAFFVGTLDIPQCFPREGPAPCAFQAASFGLGYTQDRPFGQCALNEIRSGGQCKRRVAFEED